MYYKESKSLKDVIEKSDRILINCHKDPDPDSVGSALALYNVLKKNGKKADVVCVSPEIYNRLDYLSGYKNIKKNVDFSKFDYEDYQLIVILDSSSIDRLTGSKEVNHIPITSAVIDHHKTNNKFGDINIVDPAKTSTGEILYYIFSDLLYEIDTKVADCLMAAIVGDTGAFRYPNTGAETFDTVIKLMKLGADKDKAVKRIYRNEDLNVIKFWGEVLMRLNVSNDGRYVWSAIPYNVFEKYGKPKIGKETAASNFFQIIKGTDFGFVAVEEEPKYLKISFRSRNGFDTSEIALKLGGGGHIYASGASIRGLDFEDSVKKLLHVVDQYALKKL